LGLTTQLGWKGTKSKKRYHRVKKAQWTCSTKKRKGWTRKLFIFDKEKRREFIRLTEKEGWGPKEKVSTKKTKAGTGGKNFFWDKSHENSPVTA